MTLDNQYSRMMDHVRLNPQSRERILSEVSVPVSKGRASVKLLPIAACLVLLIGISLWCQQPAPQPQRPQRPVAVGNPVIPVDSLDALSDQVGFSVWTASKLPFTSTVEEYAAFPGNLAQITYRGSEQSAILRQCPGETDCSSDYTEYTHSTEISVGSFRILLRGTAPEQYMLAVWAADGYSGSLRLSESLSDSEWEEIIAGIQ